MNESQIHEALAKYSFYHVMEVADGIFTPGREANIPSQQPPLNLLRSLDLSGKRVLDIGCRDGLFSFEAEKLGAAEVIGIDNDLSQAAVEFLIPHFQSQIQMYEMNLLNLAPDTFGLFDVVLFPGVLYHLRYPFWALKLVSNLLTDDGWLVLETAVQVDNNARALVFCPTGTESPYDPTSCTFFNLKGLVETLFSLGLTTQSVELLNVQTPLELLPPQLSLIQVATTQEAVERLSPPAIKFSEPVQECIDRATLLCRKLPQEEDPIQQYWDATHTRHTINRFYH